MAESHVLELVAPEYQEEFLQFVETGEASPEFLDYLDRDENCQDAAELALSEGGEVIQRAIDLIRRELTDPVPAGPALASDEPGRTT